MELKDLLGKVETRFERWLDTFEEKPISTGFKVVLIVLLLRWIWRSFK